MTFHQIWVFVAGIMFCTDALVLFGCVKALGPAYKDRITVGWKLRGAVSLLAVVALVRGITLVFPGNAVHVQFVPWMVPAMAVALFAVSTLATDWIIAHRAPPPVLEHLSATFKMFAGMNAASAEFADVLMPMAEGLVHPRLAGSRLRAIVIAACLLGLALLLLLVWHAAAAELPR